MKLAELAEDTCMGCLD